MQVRKVLLARTSCRSQSEGAKERREEKAHLINGNGLGSLSLLGRHGRTSVESW